MNILGNAMSAPKHNNTDALSAQYFASVTKALSDAGAYQPTLVVDKNRLDQNLSAVKVITQRGFNFRIVAKSLPCVPMLQYLMKEAGTHRLMSFHIPFLQLVSQSIPNADVLMGKPMPVGSVEGYYQFLNDQTECTFNPATQLQWLIDSEARIHQYAKLAEKLNIVLQVNLEINVGLNRGGFSDHGEFSSVLNFIAGHDNLKLSGLMGYEAHVTKIPGFLGGPKKAFKESQQSYQGFCDLVRNKFGDDFLNSLTLNAGGSTTYPLYDKPGLVNEISTASALVKPTDFDVFTLEHHVPAAFIAAPVLKMVDKPKIPMAKGLSTVLEKMGMLPAKACFIYGGNWLAQPCYPAGSKRSDMLGHSSNQEMYELAASSTISVDDFMYFRPTQSEAVFLQFGDIAVYDNGKIVDWWPVFKHSKD